MFAKLLCLNAAMRVRYIYSRKDYKQKQESAKLRIAFRHTDRYTVSRMQRQSKPIGPS
jgi:hypothetical protein